MRINPDDANKQMWGFCKTTHGVFCSIAEDAFPVFVQRLRQSFLECSIQSRLWQTCVKIGLCVKSARDAMLYPQRYPHVNKLIEATYGILQKLSLLSWEHSYPSGINRAAMEIAASVMLPLIVLNGSVTFFPARRVAREVHFSKAVFHS